MLLDQHNVSRRYIDEYIRGSELSTGQMLTGHILEVSKKGLKIACGEGAILLQEVQPQGKKLMSVAAFLNGTKLTNKDKLG